MVVRGGLYEQQEGPRVLKCLRRVLAMLRSLGGIRGPWRPNSRCGMRGHGSGQHCGLWLSSGGVDGGARSVFVQSAVWPLRLAVY